MLVVPALALCTTPAVCNASGASLQYRVWTTEEGLPQGSVYAIAQTPDGYLWIATLDGLVRFDGVRMVVYSKSEIPEMTSNRCLALLVDRQGTLWIGTEDGGVLRKSGSTFRAYDSASGLPSETVLELAEDDDGAIRAWTSAGAVVLSEGDRWVRPETPADRPAALTNGLREPLPAIPPGTSWPLNQTVLTRGARGRPWVLRGGQLHRRENDAWTTFPQRVPAVALMSPRVLFEDREGSIWIGSDQGLVQAIQTPVRAITPTENWANVSTRNVYTAAEDLAGRVWTTTHGEPFLIEGETITRLNTRSWWPSVSMTTIEPESDGTVLAGGPSGLFRVWPGRRFEQLRAGNTVLDVHRDRHGMLWVATSGGLFRKSSTGWNEIQQMPWRDSRVLLESRDGSIWVGTYQGLARITGDRVQTWTTADGLSSNRIRALHEDEAGAVWIGTYDGGLNRLADGRFTAIRKRDGLYDDGVFVILDDGAGRYYMCSNRGISSVAKADLDAFAAGRSTHVTYRAWRAVDGMPSSECNGGRQPSGFRGADGRLWFPTQAGIAVIDPGALTQNVVPPPVVIEELATARGAMPVAEPVVLDPRERRLEVRYTANTFVRPEGVRFRYRLVGYDPDWIEARSARFAHYTQLPPGHYVLRIIAANSDGVWNVEGASVAIRVLPAFHQTAWFRALIGFGTVGVITLVWWRREASLKHAHTQQQTFSRQLMMAQERERKRFAAELHDGLGQRLVIMKNLAMLVSRDHSSGRLDRAEEIAAEASRAIAEVREIAQNLRPHHLEQLGLTKALMALVRHAAAASALDIDAQIDSLEGAFPKAAEIHVYRVVQECVNNVLKHAQATEARVTIRRGPENVVLAVRDNGRGFSPAADSPRTDRGFGLTGMTERVTLLGGRVDIRSGPEQGTTVTVTFDTGRTSIP